MGGKKMGGKRKIARARKRMRQAGFKLQPRRSIISYGFPRCQLVRMVYFQQIQLDPAGTPATHVFRANSIYDPDYTNTGGHRPLYASQYDAVYNKYKVVSSRIDITGANDYSDQNNVMGNLVVCTLSHTTSAYTSITEACEAKGAKYRQCHERRPMRKLTNTFSAKKFFCLSSVKDADEIDGNMGGTLTGSNPNQQAYYVIQAYPLYQAQNTYPACLNIRLSYYVLLYDMVKVAGS